MPSKRLALFALFLAAPAVAQNRELTPIPLENSAEAAWAKKRVLARRVLDDKSDTTAWRYSGTAAFTWRSDSTRSLRVDMQMFTTTPAPTRNRLSSVNLRRVFANEDWSGYNRLLVWVRTDFNTVPRPADGSGFPVIPFQFALHSEGKDTTPDRYGREGIHYFSFMKPGVWQPVYWEIDPLPRDRVSSLEIGYWVNKMLAAPNDRMAFEIGDIELQRVEPDVHTGWSVGKGRIAVSAGYPGTSTTKTAVANGLTAREFQLLELPAAESKAAPRVALTRPIRASRTRFGTFQTMDFSSFSRPGSYVLRAGDVTSQPFIIGPPGRDWWLSLQATLNFFYGNRCGYHVPGVHNEDHKDWFATLGDQKVSMSGGWHDAGDLSQGIINTGEATYAMFALAERLGDGHALAGRVREEAKWGLDWLMRVRFPGGYKVYFSSHNLWTNNVVGDADDRSRETKNNPNANYIAAAAEAIAYRVLKSSEPELAARALELAKEDWEYAVNGVEDATTRTTPAFAASQMELAGIGITASLELFRATNDAKYATRAQALAQVILDSQQRTPIGDGWRGFFYTAPNRDTLFHQFHRGNDQSPIVALVQLLEAFPSHADAPRWREAVQLHLDFQKRGAGTTAPWNVLPSYVYRSADAAREVADSVALHGATRAAYVEQVKAGLSLGGDWYLRAMPVAFARRGNYGPLLSQTKALSMAGRFLRDSAAIDLAHKQLQWVMGRNPFTQSTMVGVGYDWSQQYSVSSGDFYGSLPVGIQNRGATDLPYWPTNNMYVWKEVWMHPSARWLWILADLIPSR